MKQPRYSTTSFMDRLRIAKRRQCPYWIGHASFKNRTLDIHFDRWNKRPQSAYKLYWRLHPGEYEAANDKEAG